jgi:hypothetical protein
MSMGHPNKITKMGSGRFSATKIAQGILYSASKGVAD